MPFSMPQFDEKIKKLISDKSYSKFLDVGAGAGKYGRMIKTVQPKAHVTGVEIDKSYIKKYKLNDIYDKVLNVDIDTLIDKHPNFTVDVAIIGDCIEHLRKSNGLDLINYLVYRTKLIIIKFPVEMVQYDWQGHDSEAHRSIWDKNDFQGFDFKYEKDGSMRLVVIKGYIKS